MSAEEADIFYMRGEGMGTKLKSETGWAPDPDCNLMNNEDFPAYPFRIIAENQ